MCIRDRYLLLYLEETYGLTNEKKIDNAIGIVANENKYHPIRDYLSSLVWDGTCLLYTSRRGRPTPPLTR